LTPVVVGLIRYNFVKDSKMKLSLYKPFLLLGALILLVGLACNIGASPTAVPTSAPPQAPTSIVQPTQASATKPPVNTAAPSGAVTNLQDVQKATIQIEAQGTFIDPQFGLELNAAGRGSGFIIDPSGIAVTNNHVVTGAALYKVWVGGDTSKTYNAKVLGVSECSDLAIIKIDGSDFPYLSWYKGSVHVGLDVYAAGFPLGDPQFTLTKGVVSKEKANGETSWASVKSVLEHTSTINPGNSGGPLVDPNGQVVGINYAGSSSTSQYFAINGNDALPVLQELEAGTSVDTIGVNGEAVQSQDKTIVGIWVSSVKSGSPADKSGVQPGDIITNLENLVLGTDGTMSDYCNILRSHKASDTLSIQVLRFATSQILTGELNGRALAVAGTFGSTGSQSTPSGSSTQTSGSDYSSYVVVKDNSNTIQMEVPAEWVEVDGSPWNDNSGKTLGVSISAAADLKKLTSGWTESGVFFGASADLAQLGGYIQVLDLTRDSFKDCKLKQRQNYDDGTYKGAVDIYYNCGGQGGSTATVLSVVPKDNSQAYEILVEQVLTKDVDINALTHILSTFKVIGSF
jgi:serine protease Do